jgi:hypothetical protein
MAYNLEKIPLNLIAVRLREKRLILMDIGKIGANAVDLRNLPI